MGQRPKGAARLLLALAVTSTITSAAYADSSCKELFQEIRRHNRAEPKNHYNVYWTTNYFSKHGRYMGRTEAKLYSAQTAQQPGGHELDLVGRGTRVRKGHPHDQPRLGDEAVVLHIDNRDMVTFQGQYGPYDPTCSAVSVSPLPYLGYAVVYTGDSIEVFNFLPTKDP
jgi:hypothetical protein